MLAIKIANVKNGLRAVLSEKTRRCFYTVSRAELDLRGVGQNNDVRFTHIHFLLPFQAS
jgi:hypothetical protein